MALDRVARAAPSLAATVSNSTETCDTGIGWHKGIRSGVRFAAMIPAIRATASTSPFLSWLARIRGIAVGVEKETLQTAVARREVGDLWEMDTIWALPAEVT